MKNPLVHPPVAVMATVLLTALLTAAAHGQLAPTRPSTQPAATAPLSTQPATQAASRPADADVTALIHQLGADDDSDRTTAQAHLVDLGLSVEDALRAAADHDADPEVRSRSEAALLQIRDREANGPTLLTVHAVDADPAVVLGQIGRQAHVELVGAFGGRVGRPGRRVTVDADRRPFWDVLADVCGQLDVCPVLSDPPNLGVMRLSSQPRNWMAGGGPHQVVGPFWVGVSDLYHTTSVDLSGPPLTDDTFLAWLIVYAEPKLVVTQISPLAIREATDDAGHSLVPAGAAGVAPPWPAGRGSFRVGSRVPTRTVAARLRYPPDHAGRRIATLAGDLTVTLAQGFHGFEATDVMTRPTVTRPLPGVRVRVAVVRRDLYYGVTVELDRDGLGDAQWQAMANRVGDLKVEDAVGRQLVPASSWTPDLSNSSTTFKATCLFTRAVPATLLLNRPPGVVPPPPPALPGEPVKIAWQVAAQFKVVTVPVAFHDLPMP